MFPLNALTTVHWSTPYAAVLGRTPPLLQEVVGRGTGLDDESGGDVSRHVHRVRELSVANIVRGNAEERLRIAAATRTRPAAQSLELNAGDQVDFWRDPQ